MKSSKFTLPSHFKLRLVWMLAGVALMGLTLSVLMKLNLGTDSYACFASGFSKTIHMSYGNGQLIAQLIMFLFVIALGREFIGLGTIANMVFIGYIADFGTFLLDSFIPAEVWSNPIVRYGSLIPALALFIFGAALYMTVELGVSPFDALPFIIEKYLPRVPFRMIRICWDLIFLLTGHFLGGTSGLVTVIGMLFLGPIISWLRTKISRYLS